MGPPAVKCFKGPTESYLWNARFKSILQIKRTQGFSMISEVLFWKLEQPVLVSIGLLLFADMQWLYFILFKCLSYINQG